MKNTAHFAQVPLAIVLVLGVSISLGGCAAETTDTTSGSGTSQSDQGNSTDAGEQAPAEGADSKGFVDPDGEVPDWVAAGFPIYPGSEVAASGEASGLTIISFSVPSVDADGEELYNWFVEQYGQNGWTARNLDAEHMSFDAENSDGRTSSVNVTKATFVMSVSKG